MAGEDREGSSTVAPAGSMNASAAGSRPSKRTKQEKSFAEKWLPKWAVYFPKFVCINNSRLALLYYVLIVMLVICIVGYFMVNDEYFVDTTPWARMSLTVHELIPNNEPVRGAMNYDTNHERGACRTINTFPYTDPNTGKSYAPEGCAFVCNTQGSGSVTWKGDACIFPEQMLQSEGSKMVFVPTYFEQRKRMARDCARWNNPQKNRDCCPEHFELKDGMCQRDASLLVPGAGGVPITFTHQFTSTPKQGAWLFSTEDKRAHSGSKGAQGWGTGMKTVLWKRTDSTIYKTYQPGEAINPTVDELLAAADYDDVGSQNELTLEKEVVRKPKIREGANGKGPKLRLIGVTLTVIIHATDKGECILPWEDKKKKVDSDGPLACMRVKAERMWTTKGYSQPLGVGNSTEASSAGLFTRQYHGVRVKFRPDGIITVFDLTTLLQIFTVAVVWIQIPLQVVYYFTIFCLGHLSSVYSRVIHQDLNLSESCKGLASRLVSHSAAYMDLQDQATGISKSKLLSRFSKILSGNKDLDDTEIAKFVDFVFEGMQSLSQATSTEDFPDTINIQEYCTACSTNEPLDFDSLVRLFDKDRKIGVLEGMFLDESIRSVVRSAKNQVDEDKQAAETEQQEAQAQMVQNLYAMEDLQAKTKEVERLAKNTMQDCMKSAKEWEDLSSKANAIASSRKNAGKNVIDPVCDFQVSADPKLDQRESFCSVADEEDPGRIGEAPVELAEA